MANEVGLYEALWRPYQLKSNWNPTENYNEEYEFETSNPSQAFEVISYLKNGIENLKENPEYYKTFNPENGWGNYDGLLEFAEEYLQVCEKFPNAIIEVSR